MSIRRSTNRRSRYFSTSMSGPLRGDLISIFVFIALPWGIRSRDIIPFDVNMSRLTWPEECLKFFSRKSQSAKSNVGPPADRAEEPMSGPIYTFAGWTLDCVSGTLKSETGGVALRPKSFDVLRFMIEH